MWQFVYELFECLWFAWGCAGLFLVIALCSVFRSRLGLDALLIRLDTFALSNQAGIIRVQAKLIEAQKRVIADLGDDVSHAREALEGLKSQMRLAGLLPWDDDENENDGS